MKQAPTLEEAVDAAVAHVGLDPIWRGNVRELHLRKDDAWRRCCGGGCDPCVMQLMRAVDFVRELLASS